MSDLIAAVATPPGTGGVGILRLSGPGAAQAAARVFRPKGTRALPDAPGRPGPGSSPSGPSSTESWT